MEQLLDRVPSTLFWGLAVGWVLGVWTAWHFARYVERLRDAINHARHHFERAKDFVGYARNNVVGFVASGATFSLILGAVGWLVWLRVSGG